MTGKPTGRKPVPTMRAIFEFAEYMPIEVAFPREPRGIYRTKNGIIIKPVCVHFKGEPTIEQIKSQTYCNLLIRWQRKCFFIIIKAQEPNKQ